jgi:hypothetical protein
MAGPRRPTPSTRHGQREKTRFPCYSVGKPAKIKPRRPHGQDANACHLRPSRGKDDVWTWDFICDRTSDGRSLKWLSLIGFDRDLM